MPHPNALPSSLDSIRPFQQHGIPQGNWNHEMPFQCPHLLFPILQTIEGIGGVRPPLRRSKISLNNDIPIHDLPV